jgi:lysyl-tRNA synthetase class 2
MFGHLKRNRSWHKNEAKKSEIKQGSQEQKQETKQPLEYFDRLKKLEEMRAAGVQPYPERYERSHTATEAQALGEKGMRETEEVTKGGVDGASRGTEISLAGRIMTFRSHGKLSFAQLQDISGRVQICFMKDVLGKKNINLQRRRLMPEIFLCGELFRTQHGEITLLVQNIFARKSLQPLPEKWYGVQIKR